MLSVSSREPLSAPTAVGAELTDNWQDTPAASVPGTDELLLRSGQAEAPPLFKLKFAERLGLFPVDGIGKVNGALPEFSTVTNCGLLVDPTAVEGNVRLGGSAKSSFTTRLL